MITKCKICGKLIKMADFYTKLDDYDFNACNECNEKAENQNQRDFIKKIKKGEYIRKTRMWKNENGIEENYNHQDGDFSNSCNFQWCKCMQ